MPLSTPRVCMHLVTVMEELTSSIKLKLDSVLCQTQIYLFSTVPVFITFEYTVVSNISRSLCIVTIYRPTPSRVNKLKLSTFLKEFENFIDCVNELPRKVLLVGYLNVHFDEPAKSDVKRVLPSCHQLAWVNLFQSLPTSITIPLTSWWLEILIN